MCSLDRSSEQLHQPSLWSRTVRLTFLLCRGKETASPVRGQGGYTHHHPGWPAVGPGGHTCPGRSRSQCAARCSCKTHRAASDGTHSLPLQPTPPFLSPCFGPPPLTWTNSPSLLPAFPSPGSFSSSSLCSHQDDLLKLRSLYRLSTAWQGRLLLPPNAPRGLTHHFPGLLPRRLLWDIYLRTKSTSLPLCFCQSRPLRLESSSAS